MTKAKQHSDLDFPQKIKKRNKAYYLTEDTIQFVSDEAKRLSTKFEKVTENKVLTAIIDFYRNRDLKGSK